MKQLPKENAAFLSKEFSLGFDLILILGLTSYLLQLNGREDANQVLCLCTKDQLFDHLLTSIEK